MDPLRSRSDPAPAARGSLAWDAVLAAGACLLDLFIFSDVLTGASGSDLPVVAVVGFAALGYLALAWRRRAPLVVFAIVWAHSMATTQMPRYAATLGLAVALYTVAAYRSPTAARFALLAAGIPIGLAVANQVDAASPDARVSTLLGTAMVLGLLNGTAWASGRWVRASRQHAADLEQLRAAEAREAVNAERARIARELHDIVAHAVTVMVMQAGGAQRILRSDVSRAEQALGRIEESGTQAMGELARMLRVLRSGDSDDDAEEQPACQPGLDDVEALVTRVRGAGIPVALEFAGEPAPLDPSVNLTAYRVVQEGLTNVTRHAGSGSRATVRIHWSDHFLVEVRNDGNGRPHRAARTLSTGHGLLGLRERVAVAGGQLDADPTGDGGFRLTATLPLSGAAVAAGSRTAGARRAVRAPSC